MAELAAAQACSPTKAFTMHVVAKAQSKQSRVAQLNRLRSKGYQEDGVK